jgi:tetratricopeptide (TPR) repeat protein
VKQTLKAAKKLFKAGEFARSATLFEKVHEMEKAMDAHAKARNFLRAGEIAISLGRGDEAVKYYLRARRYDILGEYYETRKMYLEAAKNYTRAGNYSKSANMYEVILKTFPELREIPGEIHKRPEEEMKVTRLTASAQSRTGDHKRAAELYHKIGQYDDEAKNHLQDRNYFAAGEAYTRAGMLADAGEAYSQGKFFKEAAACYMRDHSYRLAAENYHLAAQYEDAGKAYEKANDIFKASDVYAEGDALDQAIKVLTKVSQDDDTYYKAIDKVLNFSEKKHYITPAAKRMMEEFLQLEFKDELLPLYHKIAVLMEQSEFTDTAQQIYEKLEKVDPDLVNFIRTPTPSTGNDESISANLENILHEDFDAAIKERTYLERSERIKAVKDGMETTTDSLSGDLDQTLASQTKKQMPLNFLQLQEGQKFGDRYQIQSLIGSGGMGTVYRALDLELDELIAIKILSPQLSADDTIVARFKQEIKLARQINHPNVIRIHDLGELYSIKFITMEYFEGRQVKQIIADKGFFTIPAGLDLTSSICAGLSAAHKKGIVHRDVKSQNVMISDQGVVKVLDFGIAKSASIAGLTMDGSILGTPEYISPEAIMQQPVDARSDIYSLGIVMFEIFTGVVPFSGDNVIAVIRKHLYDDPPPPHSFNEGIPMEIEEVILHCIEREPEDRFQSVAELNSELHMLMSMFRGNGSPPEETQALNQEP